jgi:hypothetical protein
MFCTLPGYLLFFLLSIEAGQTTSRIWEGRDAICASLLIGVTYPAPAHLNNTNLNLA